MTCLLFKFHFFPFLLYFLSFIPFFSHFFIFLSLFLYFLNFFPSTKFTREYKITGHADMERLMLHLWSFIQIGETKSRQILMVVCLKKKYAKQCCDATENGRTHCAGCDCDQHNEYDRALWHHSIAWHLFGGKETSKSHKT